MMGAMVRALAATSLIPLRSLFTHQLGCDPTPPPPLPLCSTLFGREEQDIQINTQAVQTKMPLGKRYDSVTSTLKPFVHKGIFNASLELYHAVSAADQLIVIVLMA